jgi:hypothetical protein
MRLRLHPHERPVRAASENFNPDAYDMQAETGVWVPDNDDTPQYIVMQRYYVDCITEWKRKNAITARVLRIVNCLLIVYYRTQTFVRLQRYAYVMQDAESPKAPPPRAALRPPQLSYKIENLGSKRKLPVAYRWLLFISDAQKRPCWRLATASYAADSPATVVFLFPRGVK